jgi:chromosome segregation ATPase
MNIHSNEIRGFEKELREVEKEKHQVETKLKDEKVELLKEMHQVATKLKDEKHQVETNLKDEKEELLKEKHQVETKLKDEKEELLKEMHQVETKLKDEKHQVEQELSKEKNQVEKMLIDYLESLGKLNVRGALEYCRAKILEPNVNIHFKEPFDKALKMLEKKEDFMKILKMRCEKRKIREKDVIQCLGGLYHNASKDFHGHSHAVEIVSKNHGMKMKLLL